MYYKEMNSISFKASVQILYIVLCNYCTTCIIYRDKIKFKLKLSLVTGSIWWTEHALTGPSGMLEILLRTPSGLVSFKKLSLLAGSIQCTEHVLIKPGGVCKQV